ncbi:hypothetical protein JW926_03190 [Candidatus Sumerlaeota bacterium]|nr:hypothetical protein [Candidatus Sumerlaeota bacterium]
MNIDIIDALIVILYLLAVVLIGFLIRKQATKKLDSFFLADRNIPWWILGLSGCSSYIDIGGTMAIVGVVACLGMKSVWVTHIAWGFFMMAIYMAFQAKWIRRSGVMTFAEWNRIRYGDTREAEAARLAAALFVFILMTCNLAYIAVGIGKFAEEFFPFLPAWSSTIIIFIMVGLYVTMGGFLGVVLTDVLQTLLIAIGACFLGYLAFQQGDVEQLLALKAPEWGSLVPSWRLWEGYTQSVPESYAHFEKLGPFLLAGFFWLIFRILSGPNVWDFQFFLTAKSSRDASLAAGLWTVGFTLRWILVFSFLVLGVSLIAGGNGSSFDIEKIMPLVLLKLPIGIRGLFLAVFLAVLMSTLDAAINVTSSVVVNDFLKRYFSRKMTDRQLVRAGQIASIAVLLFAFVLSLFFEDLVTVWEFVIFVVVTMILVPATFRWHWWRFSAKAFVIGMVSSALFILSQKIFLGKISASASLALNVLGSLILTTIAGFLTKLPDMDTLVNFYVKIRPFGFWGPVRREAVSRGLVPQKDYTGLLDIMNGFLTVFFQLCLCLVTFYAFLRQWNKFQLSLLGLIASIIFLYFTWYKTLPPKTENI